MRYEHRKVGVRGALAAMVLATSAAGFSSIAAMCVQAADHNLDYRRKVVGVTGIMNNVSTGLNETVTRGEFAGMLVNASSYRDYLPASGSASLYADVPASYEYAPSIRIAADQNWMTGYLGGHFKPDQPVTMQEAARAVLALLGYTNTDYGSNISGSRMPLFYSLELNEELNRQETEVLNRSDCVNLFYNLLKAKNKSGTVYASVLGCELNSDGEVNPMGLDNSLKGPKLIRKGSQLGDYVPFNVREASIFINGNASDYDSLKSYISSGYVVVYYNSTAKTIWAYLTDEEVQTGRCAVRGTIENIYYSSAGVMTPTSVTLDDGQEYRLDSSEMQFAFSIYGSLRVGDTVTLICEKTVNANDDADIHIRAVRNAGYILEGKL